MTTASTASVWVGIGVMDALIIGMFVWMVWRQRRQMPWRCPVCRQREYYGPGFCIRDGSKLVENPAAIKPRCPKCNREHGRRDRYCKECGAKLK